MENLQTVKMDLTPTEVSVSPFIYGNFIEFIENCIVDGIYDPKSPSSDENGIRLDVLEKAKELRPTILRFPGGTYANIYHWMDAVGPKDQRKKRKNIIWGGLCDGNFGTAEFVQYCRAIGAEPMLCVNMESGTAEEAANWVEYCNGEPGTYYADLRVQQGYPEPFNVKYWCIGNESYAEADLGPHHNPDRYVTDAWEFTKHMKLMDPTIKLVFVGAVYDDNWNKKVLDAFGSVCDYFSIHHYFGGDNLYSPFAGLRNFRGQLSHLIEFINEYNKKEIHLDFWYRFPARKEPIRICMDEWNIWNGKSSEDNKYGVKMVYNWRDALWTGNFLNTFILNAEDVGIANLAQMVNVLAPIMTVGDGSFKQTTYHVLKLYRDEMLGTRVDCEFVSPVIETEKDGTIQLLDAAATLREDGTVCLMVNNISEKESFRLSLPEGYKVVSVSALSAPSLEDCNGMDTECVSVVTGDVEDIVLSPATVNRIVLAR